MAQMDERGWWVSQRNESVHPDLVRPNEKIRDELVEKLIAQAKELRARIQNFRERADEEIEAYFCLLLQEYRIDERARSRKGNITLRNFSDTQKIEVSVQETLTFDEKLQIAKLKVDEFLNDVTKGANPIIVTLVTKAFEVDKEGKIDAKRIFALKSYEINDARWQEAMSIIDESKRVSHRKPYIRFYQRESIDETYQLIPLNIAATR